MTGPPAPVRGQSTGEDALVVRLRPGVAGEEPRCAFLVLPFRGEPGQRDRAKTPPQQDLTDAGSAPLRDLLRDAVRRGDLPELDEDRAVEALAGPLFYRRFIARRPVPAGLPGRPVADFLARPPTP